MKKFHETDAGYYQVEFCNSKEVAEHGEDANREEMMLFFHQFDQEKIEQHAKVKGWDTVRITKCQETTTWYQLEGEK